jgi:hypothetical protein
MSTGLIRELQYTDDFSRISELINHSVRNLRKDQKIRCASSKPERLRDEFFGEGADDFTDIYIFREQSAKPGAPQPAAGNKFGKEIWKS